MKRKDITIVFKNGVVINKYGVVEINTHSLNGEFLNFIYVPYDGRKEKRYYRIDDIASYSIGCEGEIEDKDE